MKKIFLFLTVAVFTSSSMISCTKCYVCTHKNSTTFQKIQYCDKDMDKGDINLDIQYDEEEGYTSHHY